MGSTEAGRYLYWSDRRVRALAVDNGLKLKPTWYPTTVKTPGSVAGVPLPQVDIARTQGQDVNRRAVADRILKAVGDQAVVTFDSPPPAQFAHGVGLVQFSRFIGGPARDKGVLLHTRTTDPTGKLVDVVLFGSTDNLSDYRRSDAAETGWTSSAWYAISELLETRARQNTSQWDDPQSLSVEALKIALDQGRPSGGGHLQRPWTRGYTLGHADQSQWFAVIYSDVVLDPHRWNFRGDSCEGASRILIGAPVWVRTASRQSVVRYGQLRQVRTAGWRRWLRFPGQRNQPFALPAGLPPLPALPSPSSLPMTSPAPGSPPQSSR